MKNSKINQTLKSVLERKLRTPLRVGVLALLCSGMLYSCSSGETNYDEYREEQGTTAETTTPAAAQEPAVDVSKGVGPITSVEIGEGIDEALAAEGQAIYESKCTPCHQLTDQKIVGPGLAGVTERREPEWVMNMIINPEEMTKKDPVAKKLFGEHLIQMVNQDVDEQDARALLEYLRQNDAG